MPVRYYFLIILIFLPLVSVAQLLAPGSNAVRYTAYPASQVKDPIFIYCNSSGNQKGTLIAGNPDGLVNHNFIWYQWSNDTKSFSIPLKSESGVKSSTVDNLDEGGYRVEITGGRDTILTGWIFTDSPYSLAQLQNRTCAYVALKGKVAIDTFYYSDPSTGVRVKLPDGVGFLWSSNPSSTIPYPDLVLNPQTFDPPLVDVTYNLQVTDSFGCISNSSFDYTSIHVKADFEFDPQTGEAPLEVTFTDKSIRASKYKWEFGDDSTSTLSNPPPHIYYKPGEYSVKLTIESDLHCIDSLRPETKVVVVPSALDIPNVFTPNDDGLNDIFIPETKSLRFLNIEIFSRSGIMVYSFNGDGEKLKNWKGWNGNINNSSVKAAPGVYFYLIRALGWDDVYYNGKLQKGFLYLYR